MNFKDAFTSTSLPLLEERLGVMSIDTLERDWELVSFTEEYLIARHQRLNVVLHGTPGIRGDDKFCINVDAKLTFNPDGEITFQEFWNVVQEQRDNAMYRLGYTWDEWSANKE